VAVGLPTFSAMATGDTETKIAIKARINDALYSSFFIKSYFCKIGLKKKCNNFLIFWTL